MEGVTLVEYLSLVLIPLYAYDKYKNHKSTKTFKKLISDSNLNTPNKNVYAILNAEGKIELETEDAAMIMYHWDKLKEREVQTEFTFLHNGVVRDKLGVK